MNPSPVSVEPFARGKTFYGTATPPTTAAVLTNATDTWGGTNLEGIVRTFPDVDPYDTKKLRSGKTVTCICVRNTSGTTLYPKRLVLWNPSYRGTCVHGYPCTTGAEVAGVVDEFLPAAGVKDGDLFWIVVDGPTYVLTLTAGSDIAYGDIMYCATFNGTTQCGTQALTQSVGVVTVWDGTATSTATTDGTMSKIILNAIGRACTTAASISTSTGALSLGTSTSRRLIDVRLRC